VSKLETEIQSQLRSLAAVVGLALTVDGALWHGCDLYDAISTQIFLGRYEATLTFFVGEEEEEDSKVKREERKEAGAREAELLLGSPPSLWCLLRPTQSSRLPRA
jgi:hypothetical protein